MEMIRVLHFNAIMFSLHFCVIALFFTHFCDARRSMHFTRGGKHLGLGDSTIKKPTKKIEVLKHLDIYSAILDGVSSNAGPYGVSSPFSLPPYDSLPPVTLSGQNAPPFCVNPPFTPQPPSTTTPLPPPATSSGGGSSGGGGSGGGGGITPSLPPPSSSSNSTPTLPFTNPPLGPPGSGTGPGPSNPGTGPSPSNPGIGPSPPGSNPSPTEPILSPPYSYEPTPPSIIPGPPSNVPSPSIFVPTPPVFQPPVVYPPPAVPPPKNTHNGALWCVAKPTVPDPIIQEATNYACGSGGDCDSLQPNGSCFQPDTLFAHASYAFNSYWQRTKVAGGTCDFGGTAMLVTVDPSYDGCHFVFL